MDSERIGLLGGAAADRPVLVALVFAFGLSALAVAGVWETPGAEATLRASAQLLTAFALLPFAPMALCALLPRGRIAAGAVLALVGAAGVAVYVFAPRFAPLLPSPPDPRLAGCAFFLALTLAASGTLARVYLKGAAIGAAASILGVAGAIGLAAPRLGGEGEIALLAGLALAFAGLVAAGVAADYAAAFARGASSRAAAGLALGRALPLIVYGAGLAALATGLAAHNAGGLSRAWASAAAVGLVTASGAFLAAGGLSLSRGGEQLAVEENRRRQAQRRAWRPLRQALPVRSAYAVAAVAGIVLVAVAFEMRSPPALRDGAFAALAALAAMVSFLSIRCGLFVLATLAAAIVLGRWGADLIGFARPDPLGEAAAAAFAAGLFGQLALAWRDARSPRRNARETMETAMTEAAGRFALALLFGAGAFYAAGATGALGQATSVALYALLLALIGFVLTPPLFVALSGLGGRERF
ncbi:hypothetical protein [Amphiplicatus metriothermophilus]|uniref:Uncharacterized protein n=1 Tax=Amphiplicatus metriothermophilus TaxID=1519374 RepID=A0A239PPH5_9PROT|nr:hypothetical protein [Amphiplicatus metriothermophilus]MBB5518795.1 hypothetical protein [Amphiplicatus metriothermophilus]SNT72050.1 hypothetical protein SAMN06297382_1076 [Amphiplicatus metriothermophilus]